MDSIIKTSDRLMLNTSTLALFTDFIHHELPEVLKRNIQNQKASSILSFKLTDVPSIHPIQMALFEYQSDTNSYHSEVVKDEFMKYMLGICHGGSSKKATSSDNLAYITINTTSLLAYLLKQFPDLHDLPDPSWESDFTFQVFTHFVLEEFPLVIQKLQESKAQEGIIDFILVDCNKEYTENTAIFAYTSSTNTYYAKVKKDEFMEYLLHIPNINIFGTALEPKGHHIYIKFDPTLLKMYYQEELQKDYYYR